MLKTGFFNSTPGWGGGEKWHLDSATALAREGFPVTLFAQKRGALYQRAKENNLNSVPIKINNWSILRIDKIWKLKKLFAQEKLDTIILNLPADLKAAGVAAKWAGIRRIIYRRGSAIAIKANPINKWLFRFVVTDILANSNATKKTINQKAPLFPEEKITVIPNGLDDTAFAPPANKLHTPIRIGHLGRFVYQKNQLFLIEVAQELKKQGLDVHWYLGGEGPLLEEVRKAARLRDLPNISFLGFIDDSKAFFQTVDIVVLPSYWEGFGYVIAEAMAVGKPVVAFDISSNPELIKDGVNGRLTEPQNLEAFTHAIKELINHSDKIKVMGKKGYEQMQNNFTFTKTISKLKIFLGYAEGH